MATRRTAPQRFAAPPVGGHKGVESNSALPENKSFPRKKTRWSRKRKAPITPATISSSSPDSTKDPPIWTTPPELLSPPQEILGKPGAKRAEKVLAGGKPKTGPPTAPLLEVSPKKP
ncbi:hypothetical protein PUN28_011870 [Cardiocondyla obscurior]|uniref:Histone H3 n=1 Tax=Cardiocondyla obscurior TaxID=286306 RepID=A0AAW2FLG2_9HYME